MHTTNYEIITPDGRSLWTGHVRYNADKALFEAMESARLYRDGDAVDDNFEVFPQTVWIPADSPPKAMDVQNFSEYVLFTNGTRQWTGRYDHGNELWECSSGFNFYGLSKEDKITHYQPLPALP